LNLKNKDISELTNSWLIFESLNSSLEKRLEQKFEEKVKLELYVKQIEDKV
jgi:chorismate-pyruvate lyase